jgi:hypothetical protein
MFDRKAVYGRRWILAAIWLLGVLACASTPEPAGLALPRAVLLAPTRFDPRLAGELEPGARTLDDVIGRMLWERDVQVNAPSRSEFLAMWDAASQGVALAQGAAPDGDGARYDAAVLALADALRARGSNFDALVFPHLTLRPGAVNGHAVMWDGVARRLPFARHRDAANLLVRRGVQAPCTSLRVIAYDARGERLFERVGGLEVAKQVILARDGSGGSWSDRDDLFQDPRALRDGVEVALGPLLRN